MFMVVDLRNDVSIFTSMTTAMTNMDYDLVEIVMTISNLLVQPNNITAVANYVESYKVYGDPNSQETYDGAILYNAISMLASSLRNHFISHKIYTGGWSLFDIDRYVGELLFLRMKTQNL